MLLLRQGENGWVMAADATHEFSKVRYWNGQYKLGTGSNGRLGPFTLEHVHLDERGATLRWTGGRKTFLPSSWYQLSWR